MEETIYFYKDRIASCTAELERLKRRIHLLGTLRLTVFAGGIAAAWIFRGAGWPALTGAVAVAVAVFATLAVVHSRLFARKRYLEEMLRLNAAELRGTDYDFSAFDGAPEETDGQHAYCADLDLFGAQSLFQSMNRTVTHAGRALLAAWFKQPLETKAEILRRQDAVKELCRKTHFRQHFHITGALSGGKSDDILQSRVLFAYPLRLSPQIAHRFAIWAIPLLWLVVLGGIFLGAFSYGTAAYMFVCAFIMTNMFGVHIYHLHRAAEKMEKILKTYAQLIGQVEREPFESEELLDVQRAFTVSTGSASRAISRLSGIIGALDQRFSFAGIILNILYMRDMRHALSLEQWIATHGRAAAGWFDTLARIDALCSLGGFAFNHPGYAYPDIVDDRFRMEGRALGHPLLHRDRCVKNDVSIARRPFFLIVTGANMAGKSTYLRTVGVNFLLACTGLPVCADALTVYPARLVTSLRTADSLTAHESYFFAELKRLKMIIDRLHAGEELFVVLDEILKGTNSKDKQKGSLALMKQLIALRSCGIIATHDLLLGTLEDEFPDSTRNCCFEADIAGDTLSFDYRLRPGIARNMNASFLMKKMGITI
jgi:hypothetical protein